MTQPDTNGSIRQQDLLSSVVTTSPVAGVAIHRVTGTPTPGSAVSVNLIGAGSYEFDVSGVWTGRLSVERSEDGQTWSEVSTLVVGTQASTRSMTGNGTIQGQAAGAYAVRLRASTPFTGEAVVSSRTGPGDADAPGVQALGSGAFLGQFGGTATDAPSGLLAVPDEAGYARLQLRVAGLRVRFDGASPTGADSDEVYAAGGTLELVSRDELIGFNAVSATPGVIGHYSIVYRRY